MRYHIRNIIIIILFSIGANSILLATKPIPPKPTTAVADYIHLLTPSQKASLEQKLKVFNDTSSSAIVVVIDDSTEGEDIFEYSYRLASKWGVGEKGKDNGILLYIAFNDRKVFIQVGSGLEGVVPDAIAKRIVENVIVPAFKQGNYYHGINKATDILMSLVSGEFTADDLNSDTDVASTIFFIIFFLILFFIIYSIIKCQKDGDCNDGGGYSGRGRYNSGGGWIIGGGFGGFGGGSSGGFGGGGFGGFGGGGFSGGGAGGGW